MVCKITRLEIFPYFAELLLMRGKQRSRGVRTRDSDLMETEQNPLQFFQYIFFNDCFCELLEAATKLKLK